MIRLSACVGVALLTLTAVAQARDTAAPLVVDLWPAGAMPGQGAKGPETVKDRRVTNVSCPTLTLYRPRAKGRPMPAVIICPGGAYVRLAIDKEGGEVVDWLASLGIAGLVLKYRVPDNRAGAFQDVQRALHLARANAAAWNLDPERMGVMGFSAGGHLAARASTGFGQPAYTAVDAADRTSCRPDFAVLVYPAYLNKGAKVAPELPLDAKVPPFFLVHAENDTPYFPSSRVFAAALQAAGLPHEFHRFVTGGHGFGLHGTPETRVWPQRCEAWFRKLGVLR